MLSLTKCMAVARTSALLGALLAVAAAFPGSAAADGPTTPIATSYIATVTALPPGFQAKVVDGYLQLWLQVPADQTAVVLDYRGAPWVRFGPGGVWVNQNSEMYYLSQTPVPATPPADLSRTTPPDWQHVSSSHSYMWRDGRLHALTTIALEPGVSYVGPWSIPMIVNGRLSSVSGGVWHASAPSLLWFWPIAVIIACVLAAWRLRLRALDQRMARWLAGALLIAMLIAGAGRELHGRPTVAPGQLAILALVIAGVAYCATRLLRGEAGYFLLFAIAFAALWAGGILVPTALHPYVLMAVPAFVARATMVVCLGGGVSLILVTMRMLDAGSGRARRRRSTGGSPPPRRRRAPVTG